TLEQKIADAEARLQRLKAKSRSLDTAQKVVVGAALLAKVRKPKDSNAAWKLTSNAMSMMADMQATRRRWEELNTERKEAMSHA
ncbi:hypothetical protein, partial [Escherichia coli]|uniref:hypothetical protein n=1 Tax=Escherichia coli TaxID=562 RepID=UPI003EDF1DCF